MAVMLKAKDTPGRGCKCCPDFKPGDTRKMRRSTRRTEKQQWKRDYI
jgi:hypothetical protein